MTAADVMRQIEDAFDRLQYPGDDRIVNHHQGPPEWEPQRTWQAFRGKHWHDVIDPIFLERHYYSLSFLSHEGLRFYLPAFMITAILRFDESFEWMNGLLFTLYPPEWSGSSLKRWDEFVGLLTLEQKGAVRAFLEYIHQQHPDEFWMPDPPHNRILLALANYWNQF